MTRADTLRNALVEAQREVRATKRTLRTAEWDYRSASTDAADAHDALTSHLRDLWKSNLTPKGT